MKSWGYMLKEIFFRLKLYLFGIRFYERTVGSDVPLVREFHYHMTKTESLHLRFFEVSCVDIVLKRGRLTPEHYKSYVVLTSLIGDHPPEAMAYHGKKVFFNGRVNTFKHDVRQTQDLIADIYIDYLKTAVLSDIEKNKIKPCQAETV